MPGDLATDEEGAGEVGGDDPVPVGQADVEQWLSALQTGVVDEDFDRPDLGFDTVDTGADLALVGDVEGAGRDDVLDPGRRGRRCAPCPARPTASPGPAGAPPRPGS